MTDPGDSPGRQATRTRGPVPSQPRTGNSHGPRPAGGRAAGRAAARSRDGRSGRRAKPAARRRRIARIALITVSVLVLATAGAGAWLYQHLNGNIHSLGLTDGTNGNAGTEKADAFGRTPINMLVIGSDGRNNQTDCKLGGGCGSASSTAGHNADVEMVVHISADRSNATVMSVPRDTMTQVPACKNTATGTSTSGYYGQINSALQYGPACQVATIHQLTGIPIDHFVMLDFSGVVQMSDAVGGVSVCVSNNVYDTYSHLKLAKGAHTLKGVAALEFVRSRHGFGDGSDLGRTYAQHLFLSAMIRKFKSAGTLTDPTKVYSLADAATKALTVDTGLGSIQKLIGLATDLNKVPSKRMTFTTMQTAPDPSNSNRLVVASAAKTLFATIANDQSLSAASGKKSAPSASTSPTATATVPAAQIAVRVENGTSTTGRASVIASELTAKGFSPGTTSANAPALAAKTTLTYGAGQKAEAQTVAKALGLSSSHLTQGTATGLTLVIGADWPSGSTYPGGTTSAASADTHAAVSNAHAQTAAGSSCAKVSPYKTVQIGGVAMTPAQAYAAATKQPDSAS
ncbi:LCP family protein [Actinacidiphila oryziradicis]|uniref:LCP family protein n=1 Tax=Actinacidiphila oryziradicis TaxID=2571141 RepID=UPI001B80795E|nr:LCP family protein [Actinacidiphila oryziradicis]